MPFQWLHALTEPEKFHTETCASVTQHYLHFNWPAIRACTLLPYPRNNSTAQMAATWHNALVVAARIRAQGELDTDAEAEVRRWSRTLALPEAEAVLELERAAWLMGLGHFSAALARVKQVDTRRLGAFLTLRHATIRFISHTHTGELALAATELTEIEILCATASIPHGQLLQARCALMHCIETERIAEARAITDSFPLYRRARNAREYHLQLEQARLLLFSGETAFAGKLLAFINEFSPLAISDVHGEYLLRTATSPAHDQELAELVAEGELAGSRVGACDSLLLNGRLHLRKGEFTAALAALSRAEEIAAGFSYARRLAQALFLQGLALSHLNGAEAAADRLRAAAELARRHGFSTLGFLSSMVSMSLSAERTREFRWRDVLPMVENIMTGVEYWHYREFARMNAFPLCSLFNLRNRKHVPNASVFDLCDILFCRTSWALWWPRTAEFVLATSGPARIVDLTESPRIAAALDFILSRRTESFSLADFHGAVWSVRNFEPERHRQRAKALLLRVRELLADVLLIEFERGSQRYRAIAQTNVFAAGKRASGHRRSALAREEELSRFLREHGEVRPRDVTAALGITRQALHKYIVKMQQNGTVLVRRRGRSTTYQAL